MAEKLGLSNEEIYNILVTLSKNKILSYIPSKKTPFVVFTQERVPEKYLNISKLAYEVRKDRFVDKISKTISYVTEQSRCRSRMLLTYFGESNSALCGCCDYCLAKKDGSISNYEFESIKLAVYDALEKSDCMVFDILSKVSGFSEDKVQTVIRWMNDNNLIDISVDGVLKKTAR